MVLQVQVGINPKIKCLRGNRNYRGRTRNRTRL